MDIIISDLIEKLDINENDVFLIEDEKATYKIKASVLAEFFKSGNTGENTGTTGKDGREIELIINNNYLKWRYKGEENWTDLLDLASLKGKDGESGKDGREIELSKDSEYIKWKYTTDEIWSNLIAIEDLKIDIGTGGSGKDGKDGIDGREVEIIADETYIKWRYKGEEDWTNLVDLASLKGEDGKRLELSTDKNYIRWRCKGDETWTNLINISTLQGGKGDPGAGVPIGGTKGQVLAKVDETDYNTTWIDLPPNSGDSGGNTGDTSTVNNKWEKIIETEPTTEALSYIEFTQTDNKEALSNFNHFRIFARLKAGTTNGAVYICINQETPTNSNAIFNLANAAVSSGQKHIVMDLDFSIEKYFQGYGIVSNAASYKFSSAINLSGIKTTINEVNKIAILSPSTFGAETQITIYAKRG